MDLKEDLDKKLQNKQSIDEWLKSYQNAINVLNSSYIDEDSIKIFLLSSNQIVHFNNFVNILYKDSKLPTSKNKYYKKMVE
jgi:copper homeostasis protein CutC